MEFLSEIATYAWHCVETLWFCAGAGACVGVFGAYVVGTYRFVRRLFQ